MSTDILSVCKLLADYGYYADGAQYDDWLKLFAPKCSYKVIPKDNYDRNLPAGLIYCDSREMLEDRVKSLQMVSKFNIHTDRHLIGMPRMKNGSDELSVEAPFSVYQTEQEGDTRLFATGLYRDRLHWDGKSLKIVEKLIILDTFAVPSLLATPI